MTAISLRGHVLGAKRSNPLQMHQTSSNPYPSSLRSKRTISQPPSNKEVWLELAGPLAILLLALLELLVAVPLCAQSQVKAFASGGNSRSHLYNHNYREGATSRQSSLQHPKGAELAPRELNAIGTDSIESVAGIGTRLINGAFTHVPASANPGFTKLIDGSPLVIDSAITGVEFHIKGKVSSLAGGLSSHPRPVLKVENGSAYWQITGELSGLFTDEWGIQWLFGPIDPSGKNHRFETFGPGRHPRAGLPGAFFSLQVPVKHWNGRLAQIQAAADGGQGSPSGAILINAVDPIVLLDRGFAVFNFGAGGTVPLGNLSDGSTAVDTNPESGSGIFWTNPTSDYLVPYLRPAVVGIGGKETAFPDPFVITFWNPFENAMSTWNIGDPNVFFGNLQGYPEPVSDTVIFAKNLLRSFTGRSPKWACYIGWSGSGPNALMINSSTRGGFFQTPRSQGVQAGGGDFNVWGNRASGMRFDAFLVYAAESQNHGFFGETGFSDVEVLPQRPIAAPIARVLGDSDVALPQSAPYIYANTVARALTALGDGSKVNDFVRIYAVPKLTHLVREGYANFDRPISQDAFWYDYSPQFPNPGAFNTEGRGLRVADVFARWLPYNQPFDNWEEYPFHFEARAARSMPLLLQTLTNLHDRTEQNVPMPKSRVHPNFFSGRTTTIGNIPPYPDAGCVVDENFFLGSGVECSKLISEDSAFPTVPLGEHEIDELTYFATQNPLDRSTQPIILPDIAAPLGVNLFYFNAVLENPFITAQLRERYGSHQGYVDTFKNASKKVERERLWDRELGALYLGAC
jgi:hypothetical protein